MYVRQEGIFNPADHPSAHVGVIGLGGIGSFAAMAIAKLGVPNMTLVDFDHVEEHNVPNQFHALDQLGESKATAMRNTVQAYAGTEPDILEGKITEGGFESIPSGQDDAETGDYDPRGVMISGVDSMESRKNIWEHGKIKMNPQVKRYIDARIAGQLIVIYAVNPMSLDDIDSYEKTLHSDGEAMSLPCTERGVIDVGFMCGSVLARMTRGHFNSEDIDPVTIINMETLTINHGEWVL